jgi:hypothetical protein
MQRPLLAHAPTHFIVSGLPVSPFASRRNPSVVDLGSEPRRSRRSTIGHALKQAPHAVQSAASSGPISARKASEVSERAACNLLIVESCAPSGVSSSDSLLSPRPTQTQEWMDLARSAPLGRFDQCAKLSGTDRYLRI